MAKSELLTTPVGTLAFPTLANPRADEQGKMKYSLCLILDPDGETPQGSATFKQLQDAVTKVAKEKWGDKAASGLKSGALKNPLRDALQKEGKAGFDEGKFFFNCSTLYAPVLVDRQLNDVLDVENTFYPGCQVRAQINFYAYEAKGNKGVAVGLSAVQKYGEGERLAGGIDTKAAFGAPDKAAEEDLWD